MCLFALLALVCASSAAVVVPQPPPCDSAVFCYGDLLHTVQMAQLNPDSKSFVDEKLVNPPEATVHNFQEFMAAADEKPSKAQLEEFVAKNFEDGNELEPWTPEDYNESPEFLQEIPNATVREFAQHLVGLWPKLAKKVKPDVVANPDLYSIIAVPNGFVVPGGRFREYYYWDSYWVLHGLVISKMTTTARGMIENFFSLVERFGFVPNGGRVYYLNRSQPPMLTSMVYLYYKETKDTKWLEENIHILDLELNFWLVNRTLQVSKDDITATLAHYSAESSGPRPESYIEDYNTAEVKANKDALYMDIKSGAEAGWDFSSRWFFDADGGNQGNLSNIETRRVVPVDLNAILCGSFRILAELYLEVNDVEKSVFWGQKFLEWQRAVQQVLWDEEAGVWFDFDAVLLRSRKYFYPSNTAPLWMKCFEKKKGLGARVVRYLQDAGMMNYLGGLPTSLEQTGEQWDFPNAWPPLQEMVVQGLVNSEETEAQEVAQVFASRWVESNLMGYLQTGDMYEKYDAVNPGRRGGGGEYGVQTGFGWSNGVVLRFIYDFFREK